MWEVGPDRTSATEPKEGLNVSVLFPIVSLKPVILILLAGVLFIAGCTQSPDAARSTPASAATPAPIPTATPAPKPTPTPELIGYLERANPALNPENKKECIFVPGTTGAVEMSVEPVSADIAIDGAFKGRTTPKELVPLRVSVDSGEHDVRVANEFYYEYNAKVCIHGQLERIRVSLWSLTAPTPRPPSRWLSTPPPATPPIVTITSPITSTPAPTDDVERTAFNLVNMERKNAGLPATVWDDGLYRQSLAHTQEMARRGTLFHTPVGASYGENAWGGEGYYRYSSPELASTIVNSWMSSPLHRAWILHASLRTSVVSIVSTPSGQYASWTFLTGEAGAGPLLIQRAQNLWLAETGGGTDWITWLYDVKGYPTNQDFLRQIGG